MKKIFLLIALIISFNTATIKTAPDRTHVFTAVVIASATYYFHQEINNFIKNTRKNICACRNQITKSFNKFCKDIKKEFNKIKLPSFTFPWTIIIDVNSNQQTIVEAGEEVTKEFPLTNLNGINAWGPGNVVIECNPNLKEEKLTIITDKNVFDVLEHYPKFKTFNFGPESNIHFKKTPTINYIVYVKHLNKLNISGSLNVSTNTIIAPSEDITIDLSGSGSLECNITANNFVLNDSGSRNITFSSEATTQRMSFSGSSKVIQSLKANDLYIKLSGSTNVSATIDANNFELRDFGCGNIALNGSAKKQTLRLSGSAHINASELKTEETTINASGSSDISVWVINKLTCKSSGSSDIKYYGNPHITKSQSGSGKIKQIGY